VESQIRRGRGKPKRRKKTIRFSFVQKKTIRETTRKDLDINELDPNRVLDKTLWRNLIHIIDST